MELAQEVSFLNKAAIKQTFAHLPEDSKLILDASHSIYIDHDVLLMINNFVKLAAPEKNIQVTLTGFRKEYKIENTELDITYWELKTNGMEQLMKSISNCRTLNKFCMGNNGIGSMTAFFEQLKDQSFEVLMYIQTCKHWLNS